MVSKTTGVVLFPAHPCRDVLLGLTAVLYVIDGVEGGGGYLLVPKRDMSGGCGTTQDMGVTQAQHLLPSILPLLGVKGFYPKDPTQGTGEHQGWGQPLAAPRNDGHEGRNWDKPPVPRKLSSSKGNLHKE